MSSGGGGKQTASTSTASTSSSSSGGGGGSSSSGGSSGEWRRWQAGARCRLVSRSGRSVDGGAVRDEPLFAAQHAAAVRTLRAAGVLRHVL